VFVPLAWGAGRPWTEVCIAKHVCAGCLAGSREVSVTSQYHGASRARTSAADSRLSRRPAGVVPPTTRTMSTKTPRPVRFALVQFDPLPPGHSPSAPHVNLARAYAFIAEAAAKGANVVVFPEFFISGVPLSFSTVGELLGADLWLQAWWRTSFGTARALLSRSTTRRTSQERLRHRRGFILLAEQAILHQVDIVAGSILEKASEQVDGKDVLSNVAHYINKNGEVLGRYKKVTRTLMGPTRGAC
jgi:hypothetical protein